MFTCSLITNHEKLQSIWDGSLACFARMVEEGYTVMEDAGAALPPYVELCLVLLADIGKAENALDNAYDALIGAEVSPVAQIASYRYADAAYAYARYVGEGAKSEKYAMRSEELWHRYEGIEGDDKTQAHRMGCMALLHRMGRIGDRDVSFYRSMGQFQAHYYSEETGLYTEDATLNCLPAYYGFLADDGYDSVREYLSVNSFSVPTEERRLLLGGLYQLEAYDALLPILLEGGVPGETSSGAMLGGLCAFFTYLLGIDTEMLGKGIRCFRPTLSEHVWYRLILPSVGGRILFEGGEAPDEFMG